MAWTVLLITALATAALSYLLSIYLVEEEGPIDIFGHIRKALGVNVPILDPDGEVVEYAANGSYLSRIMTCRVCNTPYTSVIAWALFIVTFDLLSIESVWGLIAGIGMATFAQKLT